MKLKSYFSNSVQDAIEKARVELGAEAVLISSNATSNDLKDLGAYEVIFGVSPDSAHLQRSDGARIPARASVPSDPVLREISELRKQMETLGLAMNCTNLTRTTEQLRPELREVLHRLMKSGFSTELSHEIVEAVSRRARVFEERSHRMIRDHRQLFARDLLNASVEEEIADRFETQPSLGRNDGLASVMVVGPPGAGKTSSLMKLALQYGVREKRAVRLLSLDTLRIGGYEQLGTYARIAGVQFEALQGCSMLGRALHQQTNSSLTLIDTPGFSAVDEQQIEDWAGAVRNLSIDTHLVVPASVRMTVARQIFERFDKFQPNKLLLTHVDATTEVGSLIELSSMSELPLSFLGTGQQVPEDLEEATKPKLLEELRPHERAISTAA